MQEDRLTSLYRRFGSMIHARCRRMLADDAAAEDATQETFVRVHRNIARAPSDREALAWIYRIATNYCLNQLRSNRRRPEVLTDVDSAGGDTERALADRSEARHIIACLPERLRLVAALYHVDGLRQREVARTLRLSRRTIVTCLSQLESNAHSLLLRSAEPSKPAQEHASARRSPTSRRRRRRSTTSSFTLRAFQTHDR